MEIVTTIAQSRSWVKERRSEGKKIGFVPTMGYLHQGHLSLAEAARTENEAVVMSIFVNPLQFGPSEDYNDYPRDLERDAHRAEEAGVSIVFAPEVSEMYPYYPQLTTVEVEKLTTGLCGTARPGHFKGVCTVVNKLFNILQPDTAYFGQKDYQQVQVIKRMVADLNIPVAIKMVPTKREKDGLAMSSRNTYLAKEERKQSLCLYQSLLFCKKLYTEGIRDVAILREAMENRIAKEPSAVIEYLEICDADTLEYMTEINKPAVAALAVKIGRTRLIDNILLEG